MKEAIGGTSLFVIVIVILSVFAIYISISVNWSTAIKVKNEIIFYIEKNKGLNNDTLKEINTYLSDVGYFTSGTCPGDSKQGWNGYNVGKIDGYITTGDIHYCVSKVNYIKNQSDSMDRSYYRVRTFFMLDLPIIRRLGLTIDGETKVITNPKDDIEGVTVTEARWD